MTVGAAQREMREVFSNGSIGQLVAGGIWLASAALATWGTKPQAIVVLVAGGAFIYPLTQLILRLRGRRFKASSDNPLTPLALQVAFIVPLTLPIAGGAALHDINWFYPAVTVIVGAHYLPFASLYGLRTYAALGAILIASGLGFALFAPHAFAWAGWFTGAVLVACSAWLASLNPHPE
ncbi:MAG TPA: hypothetical protein VNE16_03565 [Vicinamibacterales bacterium]|nr:hypothetical protein [Vicinamibacterales bacterium]